MAKPIELFGSLCAARLTLNIDGKREVLTFDVNGLIAERAHRDTPGTEELTMFGVAATLALAYLSLERSDHPLVGVALDEFKRCMVPPSQLIPVPDFDANSEEGLMDPLASSGP